MSGRTHDRSFGGGPAENYQRYFVPAIGSPLAEDLVDLANLKPGDRVLDVACGTGVVARLAAQSVGDPGMVAGLDVNPAMLAVAAAETPPGLAVAWYEASAESMPLPDDSFDIVLCQMGLQFFADASRALGEMRRVLDVGGRAVITLPGPTPRLFAIMADALTRHLGPESASFVDIVFSLHDEDALAELMSGVGFREVAIEARPKRLRLPTPADFLWQYVHSTPLSRMAAEARETDRADLEGEICARWLEFVDRGALSLEVRMTTASGFK